MAPSGSKKPLALHCSHTFCKGCLSRLETDSSIECPTCRRITSGTVESIPVNSLLIRMMDSCNLHGVLCNNCENRKNKVSSYCLDCRTLLCEECKMHHNKMKSFRDHSVSSDLPNILQEEMATACDNCDNVKNRVIAYCVDCRVRLCDECKRTHSRIKSFSNHCVSTDLSIEMIPRAPIQESACLKHPDEMIKFYCSTCNEFICRDCIVYEHPAPSHNHKFIGAALEEFKGNMAMNMATVPELLESALAERVAVENKLAEFAALTASTCAPLEAHFDDLVHRFSLSVDNYKQSLIRPYREVLSAYAQTVEDRVKGLNGASEHVTSELERIREHLESGSAVDILQSQSRLCEAVAACQQQLSAKIKQRLSDPIPFKTYHLPSGAESDFDAWIPCFGGAATVPPPFYTAFRSISFRIQVSSLVSSSNHYSNTSSQVKKNAKSFHSIR
jgi:hypothetical protein